MRNVLQDCKDLDPQFKEQLTWFLTNIGSFNKSDMVKIGIMSHAGKEASEVYKKLHWSEEGGNKKLNKITEVFGQHR